jgi:hypothetical protein
MRPVAQRASPFGLTHRGAPTGRSVLTSGHDANELAGRPPERDDTHLSAGYALGPVGHIDKRWAARRIRPAPRTC